MVLSSSCPMTADDGHPRYDPMDWQQSCPTHVDRQDTRPIGKLVRDRGINSPHPLYPYAVWCGGRRSGQIPIHGSTGHSTDFVSPPLLRSGLLGFSWPVWPLLWLLAPSFSLGLGWTGSAFCLFCGLGLGLAWSPLVLLF